MIRVEVREDHSVFDELAPWWDSQPGPLQSPFLRSEWFRAWATTRIEPPDRLKVIVASDDGDPVAAVPLVKRGRRHFSLSDGSSDSYDMVHGGDERVADYLVKALRQKTFIALERVEGSSPLVAAVGRTPGWRIQKELTAPYIDLSGGVGPMLDHIGKNLRKNIGRGQRRLEMLGNLTFHPTVDRIALESTVAEAFALEATGWKGGSGRAVANSPTRRSFYTEIAEIGTRHDWLRLSALRLDGRMVAFNYDLDFGGRRFGILTSYDETLDNRCSPGSVLLWHVLEDCADRGLRAYELGGDQDNVWSLMWTSVTRRRADIIGYGSNSEGRLVRALAPVRRRLKSHR